MVSGRPLHPDEEKYIRDHRDDFPSVTARHLGYEFAHLNGGFRSTQTVRDYLKKLEDQDVVETPRSGIPGPGLPATHSQPALTPVKKKTAPTQRKKKEKEIEEDARASPTS